MPTYARAGNKIKIIYFLGYQHVVCGGKTQCTDKGVFWSLFWYKRFCVITRVNNFRLRLFRAVGWRELLIWVSDVLIYLPAIWSNIFSDFVLCPFIATENVHNKTQGFGYVREEWPRIGMSSQISQVCLRTFYEHQLEEIDIPGELLFALYCCVKRCCTEEGNQCRNWNKKNKKTTKKLTRERKYPYVRNELLTAWTMHCVRVIFRRRGDMRFIRWTKHTYTRCMWVCCEGNISVIFPYGTINWNILLA